MTTKKKVITVILIVVIAALILGSVYFMQRMPKYREATQEEIAGFAVYKVDWKSLEGFEGMSEKDIILSMCVEVDPQTMESVGGEASAQTTAPASGGETTASEADTTRFFTSDTLGEYLHLYQGGLAVTLADGILSVGYTAENGLVIVLGYNDEGFYALGVHSKAEDFAYFEQGGKASVATNVSGSFGG